MNKKNLRDLAYTAGALDSDGYFGIARCNTRRQPFLQPVISCEQNDTRIINFLFGRWGGGTGLGNIRKKGIREDILVNGKPITANPTFWWRMQNISGAIKLLKKLIPFLRIKKHQAELLLRYCYIRKEGVKRIRKQRFSERQIEDMKKIYEELKNEKKNHRINLARNSIAPASTKRERHK